MRCPNCGHLQPDTGSDKAALRRMERKLDLLLKKEGIEMAELATLTAEVANNTSVEQSAVTLLGNLKTALDAAGTDPVALKALSDQLAANDAALAAAVVANTPAAPAA